MILKALIFDLDGVITDTAELHFIAWQELADSLDIPMGEEENEQIKGLSRRASLEKILEIGGVEVEEERIEVLTDQKNNRYLELLTSISEDDTLIGFREFLADCKANNLKVAVGSASRNAKQILTQLGLINEFDAIVDGSMVEHSKPNPEVFLMAAEMMAVSPENTVVFEDAISGIQAANAGGFFSIGVGDEKTLNEADAVIPNMNNFTVADLQTIISQ